MRHPKDAFPYSIGIVGYPDADTFIQEEELNGLIELFPDHSKLIKMMESWGFSGKLIAKILTENWSVYQAKQYYKTEMENMDKLIDDLDNSPV